MDLNNELRTARWVKSSHSGDNGGDCVEIAPLSNGRIGVRDSKDRLGSALVFPSAAWDALLDDIKAGKYSKLA